MSKEEVSDTLASAQLEKVRLEIENLRNARGWHDRITSYTTVLSVLIAVGGFLVGIYQFQKQQQIQSEQRTAEQQKDRANREREQSIGIQNQIRSDMDQILKFAQDKEQTVARITFLLDDLKRYLEIERETAQINSRDATIKNRKISGAFVKAILDDCNFDESRNVKFATTLLNDWEDLGQYLKEHPDYQARIANRLADSILKIYSKDPKVIATVQPSGEKYWYPDGYGKLTATEIFHFQDMAAAYVQFFKFLDGAEIRERIAFRFQQATCNAAATKTYFNISFDPKDTGALSHCVKGSRKRGY